MNRSPYFEYIEDKLHILARKIETRGKLNILNLNVHSENFYLHFFKLLYGYQLENLNTKLQNVEAIDLLDQTNKLIIQVSATCTKQKIESALKKEIIKKYSGYTFKFISITKDASQLRKEIFGNPYSINFNPENDIYDIASILNTILSANIDKLKAIYVFIKEELGSNVDIVKLDSNLASIINILAEEQWDNAIKDETTNRFEIDRKITFNNLDKARGTVEEYSLYYGKVDAKYSEFDSFGRNKSNSVLATINREYRNLKSETKADDVFLFVIERIKNKVLESTNFNKIPIDELELCIDILVVDAFIRCKIFENPENYNYAPSR